jgi:hypothetical protein
MKTRMEVIAALALAALIVSVIAAVAPKATIIANDVTGEVYGIDVLAITKDAKDLPVEQFAAY